MSIGLFQIVHMICNHMKDKYTRHNNMINILDYTSVHHGMGSKNKLVMLIKEGLFKILINSFKECSITHVSAQYSLIEWSYKMLKNEVISVNDP